MDFLFENFQILVIIGLAAAAWLKKRAEMKEEAEAEQRAREEMVRGLKQAKNKPPTPSPHKPWETSGQQREREAAARPHRQPPPPPLVWSEEPEPAAAENPWSEPEPLAMPFSNAEAIAEQQQALLQNQQDMQQRLAQIKQAAEKVKRQVGGARATQQQVERKNQAAEALVPLRGLRAALKDSRQVRRAVVLREILGPPVGIK